MSTAIVPSQLGEICTKLTSCIGDVLQKAGSGSKCEIFHLTLTAEGYEKIDQKCIERYSKELAALNASFSALPVTRLLSAAFQQLDERGGLRLTEHLYERSSKMAYYKYEAEKLRQLYTYTARMMRRKVFSRSVSMNVLRRSWQDGGDGESPSTATADDSQTSESPTLAIEDATIPTSPIPTSPIPTWPIDEPDERGLPRVLVLGEDMPTYPESESDFCAEILSEEGGNECIDLDDSDVDMPYPSAGSAAAEEAHKTIDVAQQRKQTLKKKPASSLKKKPASSKQTKKTLKKKPATNAPVDSVVSLDEETVDAISLVSRQTVDTVNPDQHIARDCLRVVFKKERGKEFWVIKFGKHQLMQVTLAMAGSNEKAKALCTFLISMFDHSSLGAVRDARRRLLAGESVWNQGLLCNIDSIGEGINSMLH